MVAVGLMGLTMPLFLVKPHHRNYLIFGLGHVGPQLCHSCVLQRPNSKSWARIFLSPFFELISLTTLSGLVITWTGFCQRLVWWALGFFASFPPSKKPFDNLSSARVFTLLYSRTNCSLSQKLSIIPFWAKLYVFRHLACLFILILIPSFLVVYV